MNLYSVGDGKETDIVEAKSMAEAITIWQAATGLDTDPESCQFIVSRPDILTKQP